MREEGKDMGFRFRKRIKILPGVWFNLSKSGISTSIGGKGLTVNLKDGKTKTTIGIPGTGLSYSETATGSHDDPAPEQHIIPAWVWLLIVVVIALVFIAK
jgi:L,D-peptidoglycan transpeptidase YkuD (ErfK/YbiS/YcfS/YnhG family)